MWGILCRQSLNCEPAAARKRTKGKEQASAASKNCHDKIYRCCCCCSSHRHHPIKSFYIMYIPIKIEQLKHTTHSKRHQHYCHRVSIFFSIFFGRIGGLRRKTAMSRQGEEGEKMRFSPFICLLCVSFLLPHPAPLSLSSYRRAAIFLVVIQRRINDEILMSFNETIHSFSLEEYVNQPHREERNEALSCSHSTVTKMRWQ